VADQIDFAHPLAADDADQRALLLIVSMKKGRLSSNGL